MTERHGVRILLGAVALLLLAGCSTTGGFALGREYTLVYVRTGAPGQFNIPATNEMPCDRLWSVKVAQGFPAEDGTARFGGAPSVVRADEALICSFDGVGPTPNAPKGIEAKFAVVRFPTGITQVIRADGFAASLASIRPIPRLPPEVLQLCPFPSQYMNALHSNPYPSKLTVGETMILDQWEKCAGPRLKAGG